MVGAICSVVDAKLNSHVVLPDPNHRSWSEITKGESVAKSTRKGGRGIRSITNFDIGERDPAIADVDNIVSIGRGAPGVWEVATNSLFDTKRATSNAGCGVAAGGSPSDILRRASSMPG